MTYKFPLCIDHTKQGTMSTGAHNNQSNNDMNNTLGIF